MKSESSKKDEKVICQGSNRFPAHYESASAYAREIEKGDKKKREFLEVHAPGILSKAVNANKSSMKG